MITPASRTMIRILGGTPNELPKTLLNTVRGSKKSRRRKRRQQQLVETDTGVHSSLPPHSRNLGWNCADESTIVSRNNTGLSDAIRTSTQFASHTSVEAASLQALAYSSLREDILRLLSNERRMFVNIRHLLIANTAVEDKMDSVLRDQTLSRLRCLHGAFYGLSTITFCRAVCLMDSFLSRVKVKSKYALCVASACYYIASKFEPSKDITVPTPENLVTLSRCGGTAMDLTRMVEIILSKLSPPTVASIGACCATTVDFLRCFAAFAFTSSSSSPYRSIQNLPSTLYRQMEVALSYTKTVCFRPSCIALALLKLFTLEQASYNSNELTGLPRVSLNALYNLTTFCILEWSDVEACAASIREAIAANQPDLAPCSPAATPCKVLASSPPLVWQLSRRTQRSISTSQPPTLPTINETAEETDLIQCLASTHVGDTIVESDNSPVFYTAS